MELLNEIEEALSAYSNLYDSLRIVDPLEKRIVLFKNDNIECLNTECYGVWKRNKFCDNCVSMRACNEKDLCVKVEYRDSNIILVIAIPIDYKGTTYSLELFKNISKETNPGSSIMASVGAVEHLFNEIENKITVDNLTGIYNKRYILERLPADINKCAKNKMPLSIIMGDIDSFKKVKESYGDGIANKVLKDISRIISENICYETCWAARYGEDEFIIVLNNTDKETAYDIAEKIRKKIEGKDFSYGDIHINITLSYVVNSIKNMKIEVNDLIKEIEIGLKKVIAMGKND